MATRPEDLLNSALTLPPDDRARIAAELIASLDGEAEADVEGAWLIEVDRRIDEVGQRREQLIDREKVSAEVREALACLSLVSRRKAGSPAKATRR